MANNLIAGYRNIVIAKKDATLQELGFNESNLIFIRSDGPDTLEYDPAGSINSLTGIRAGKGYEIFVKTNLDRSDLFAMPFPAEVNQDGYNLPIEMVDLDSLGLGIYDSNPYMRVYLTQFKSPSNANSLFGTSICVPKRLLSGDTDVVPLVIYSPGLGDRSTSKLVDLTKPYTGPNSQEIIKRLRPFDFISIQVMSQYNTDVPASAVMDLINMLTGIIPIPAKTASNENLGIRVYPIDLSRVYGLSFSAGSAINFKLNQAYPTLMAAIVSISGIFQNQALYNAVDCPVLVLQNQNDETVNISNATTITNALITANPVITPEKIIYPSGFNPQEYHDAVSQLIAGKGDDFLWKWLTKWKKSGLNYNIVQPHYLPINYKFPTTLKIVPHYGYKGTFLMASAFNPDGTNVQSFVWSKISGTGMFTSTDQAVVCITGASAGDVYQVTVVNSESQSFAATYMLKTADINTRV